MYRAFIKNYICNLTPIQVKQFASEKHVTLSDTEANYITNFIKQNWEELLYHNPEPLFQKAAQQVRQQIIQKEKEEFYQAKQKYQSFL